MNKRRLNTLCDVSFNAAVYEYMIATNGTRLHVCFVHMYGCFVPYSNLFHKYPYLRKEIE